MASGSFYSNSQTEVVVDPFVPPSTQSQTRLQSELKRCEQLVQRDYRYAQLVAGAAKMAMPSIWAARNQDELVNDRDLATFKDISWTEFVKKRFLPTVPAGESVATAATSMLEIVREMNLQRRKFQIMGLHEQVEACEIQLVMHLCQAGLIRAQANDFKRTALRMRRSQKLHEAFAIAVGACVCASAPMTMGSGVTRYERDLQMEYKKHTIGLLVFVLQKNPGAIDEEEGLDEDYVARIARLIVLWQGNGSGRQQVGEGRGDEGGSGTVSSDYKESVKQHLIGLTSALGIAQRDAEKAKNDVIEMRANMGKDVEKLTAEMNRRLSEFNSNLKGAIIETQAKFQTTMADQRAHTATMLKDAISLVSAGPRGGGGAAAASSGDVINAMLADSERRINESMKVLVDKKIREADIDTRIKSAVRDEVADKVKDEVGDALRITDLNQMVAQAVARTNVPVTIQTAVDAMKRDNDASLQRLVAGTNLDQKVQDAVRGLDIAGQVRGAIQSQETADLISRTAKAVFTRVDIRPMVKEQVDALNLRDGARMESKLFFDRMRGDFEPQFQASIGQLNARIGALDQINAGITAMNAGVAVAESNYRTLNGNFSELDGRVRSLAKEVVDDRKNAAQVLEDVSAKIEKRIRDVDAKIPSLVNRVIAAETVAGNCRLSLVGETEERVKMQDNIKTFNRLVTPITTGLATISGLDARLKLVESSSRRSVKRPADDDDGGRAAGPPSVSDADVQAELQRQIIAKLHAVDADVAARTEIAAAVAKMLAGFDLSTYIKNLPMGVKEVDDKIGEYVAEILNAAKFVDGVNKYLDALADPMKKDLADQLKRDFAALKQQTATAPGPPDFGVFATVPPAAMAYP